MYVMRKNESETAAWQGISMRDAEVEGEPSSLCISMRDAKMESEPSSLCISMRNAEVEGEPSSLCEILPL